jgi:hypothetical protein
MNPLVKIEYIVIVTAVVAALAAYFSWKSSAKVRWSLRVAMALARVFAILLLGVIAVNPGRWKYEITGKESEWVILVDKSGSMGTADVEGRTRFAEAGNIAESIRKAAGTKVKNRTYAFSGDLEVLPDGSDSALKPDGHTTDIIRAGKSALERYRSGDKKLAGLILLSDGRQIGRQNTAELSIESRAQEVPIYTIPIGGRIQRKDLSVAVMRRHYVAFKGQKLKIGGTVHNSGMGNISTEVQLTDPAGTVLLRQKIELPEGKGVPFQIELAADKKGYIEYRINVPPAIGEISAQNNLAAVSVAVLENKIRVFIAEGQPGWDSKFIIQLLRKQANMEVTSV